VGLELTRPSRRAASSTARAASPAAGWPSRRRRRSGGPARPGALTSTTVAPVSVLHDEAESTVAPGSTRPAKRTVCRSCTADCPSGGRSAGRDQGGAVSRTTTAVAEAVEGAVPDGERKSLGPSPGRASPVASVARLPHSRNPGPLRGRRRGASARRRGPRRSGARRAGRCGRPLRPYRDGGRRSPVHGRAPRCGWPRATRSPVQLDDHLDRELVAVGELRRQEAAVERAHGVGGDRARRKAGQGAAPVTRRALATAGPLWAWPETSTRSPLLIAAWPVGGTSSGAEGGGGARAAPGAPAR
jgi:hypothetical protein